MIVWATSVLTVCAICGCGRGQSGSPKIQQLQVGMTVQQVKEILGKPTWIHDAVPGGQVRQYPGDADCTISVHFKDGAVEMFKEHVPKHKLPIG